MRTPSGAPNTAQMLVFVPPHPLLKHWLAVARSATPPALYRSALAELGRLLVYEAARDWLPTVEGEVETPAGALASVEFVDASQAVLCVPLLPQGLVMLEQCAAVLPAQRTAHVAYSTAAEPQLLLDHLPDALTPESRVLVSEPVISTAAALCLCLDSLLKRGARLENIRVLGAVAAPPALKRLSAEYPGASPFATMPCC
jgi:uracil phosphoribosyltransferase